MNRVKREAVKKLGLLPVSEQRVWTAMVSAGDKLCRFASAYEHQFGCPVRTVDAYLAWRLPEYISMQSATGPRVPFMKSGDDRCFEREALMVPTGRFQLGVDGFYHPEYIQREVRRRYRDVVLRAAKVRMEKSWADVYDRLSGGQSYQGVGLTGVWCADPALGTDGQHVYFALDRQRGQVKIGVSADVARRLKRVERRYGRQDLQLLAVIPYGGRASESALHQTFRRLRCQGGGEGREWFRVTRDLMGYVLKLNRVVEKRDLVFGGATLPG
ncbi:GIY-YIG nuclease family protein [Ferrimonas marina]|uniref:Meiotically up-regulated gene 113 n=1 Tax=Ferrimonas marina TaxID=299255 RepID=A0A1M5TSY0_9GAMM|nr:GIY-YIG nuclease family protein [Ferrimonas marina]SHH53750.1 Meiotically up-regulated gene 113 [Ferrimonas marina]